VNFTTKSGNTCVCRIERKGDRTAAAVTWRSKPSKIDTDEFELALATKLKNDGVKVDNVGTEYVGSIHNGAVARQTEHIRKFLKTGETP
jgi:hypothetical protein